MVSILLRRGLRRWARYRNVGDQCPIQAAILHSFGLRSEPWTTYPAATLRTEMSRRKSVVFHDHSLLTARLSGGKSDSPFVDYINAD